VLRSNYNSVVQKKPTLTIGHHLLEGKIVSLPKPIAVIQRSSKPRPKANLAPLPSDDEDSQIETQTQSLEAEDLMDMDIHATQKGSDVEWNAIAIVRRKIIFSKRPMPIATAPK
jgi:chromosome transmission fidelity protein 8